MSDIDAPLNYALREQADALRQNLTELECLQFATVLTGINYEDIEQDAAAAIELAEERAAEAEALVDDLKAQLAGEPQ